MFEIPKSLFKISVFLRAEGPYNKTCYDCRVTLKIKGFTFNTSTTFYCKIDILQVQIGRYNFRHGTYVKITIPTLKDVECDHL